jgi:hypothetical protein
MHRCTLAAAPSARRIDGLLNDHPVMLLGVAQRRKSNMPTLTVGKRSYQVSDPRVTRQAVRMFKMNPERRSHRVEAAKTQLVRAAQGSKSEGVVAAERRAAAILLCQGVKEI